MTTTYRAGIKMETLTCARCSMPFGQTQHRITELRRNHETFYCPAGHRNVFNHESDLEREMRWRKSAEKDEESRRHELDFERRSHASTKGHLTRMRNKINRGVCPYCDTTFKNVRRHMTRMHETECKVEL